MDAARHANPERALDAAVALARACLAAADLNAAKDALGMTGTHVGDTAERVQVEAWLADAHLSFRGGATGRGRRSLERALRLAGPQHLRLPFALERSWLRPALERHTDLAYTHQEVLGPRLVPAGMFLALGIATVIYVAIALGVFGTLTVDKVISSGGTAIAVAAEPTLGRAGYWLMTVTALFATAGATNAGLYPAQGLSERLAETGQFPPLMARKLKGRVSAGLLIQAAICLVLAVVFRLDSIASIGSAVALVIFTLITAAHVRIRAETGASLPVLVLAIAAAAAVFVTFVFTTLIHEPASMVTLLGVLVVSIALDYGWKHFHAGKARHVQLAH
jgi:hypothetical protein